MEREPRPRRFGARAARLIALCVLPLAALVVGLAVEQFLSQRAAALADLARVAEDQHQVVAAVIADADRTLGRMRGAMRSALADPVASPLRSELRPETVTIDGRPLTALTLGERDGAGRGALIGVLDLPARPAETQAAVDAGLRLLDVTALEHSVSPGLRWSYFFSAGGDFITIHPAARLADLAGFAAKRKPLGQAADLVAYWLSYDVFKLGAPDRNPDRRTYWTRIYDDAGGAGPVISHAAPIYDGDRFVGIVGTDLSLSVFGAALKPMADQIGLMAIVGEGGDLLALDGPAAGALSRSEAERLIAEARPDAGMRPTRDGWAMALGLEGSPFRLVYVVSAGDVAGLLLPRLAPYAVIVFALAAASLAGLWLLRREFLRPSLALADHIRRSGVGDAAAPAHWRPLFDDVTRAFEGSRAAAERRGEEEALKRANATLERRIAERTAELSAARDMFVAAAESLPDGLAIFDADERFVYFNARYPEHLAPSLRAEVAIGRAFGEALRAAVASAPVYHADHGPDFASRRIERRRALGPASADDHVHRLSDGRWVRVRERRMADGGVVLLTSDVTEQTAATARLKANEERYRAVVETQTELVARFGPDGRTTFVNGAYCRHMGMTAEELTAPGFDGFMHIVPEDLADHDAHLARLSPEGPTATIVFRAVLPDGTLHWEEWTDTGVFAADGQLIEIQSVGRDITEKKLAEEQLKESQAELERQRAALHQNEKLAALGSLLAGVAHEMNNPLSIVVGYSQMLTEFAPDEATRRRAQEINVAAERCARIVKSFLAMARSKPLERRPADIDEIVDSVLELAGYGLRRAGVAVSRRRADNGRAIFVDEDQIHQVVMNLVLNAQHALEGRPDPVLTIAAESGAGGVRLTVADNGCGMDETVRARAFEPFFTTKPQGVGTGVGLSICHGVIAAHGGSIELFSAPGEGARFELALPVWEGEARRAQQPAGAPRLAGRLLVVDDEPAIAELIGAAFADDAVEVITASSAREALARVAAERFDALLSDLRMPGMGGEELIAEAVRMRPELQSRVFVMTGDALGVAPQAPMGAPVLEKPLDLAAVRLSLAAALGQTSPARTLQGG